MAISANQKPTIYRNLYENTGPATSRHRKEAILREVTRQARGPEQAARVRAITELEYGMARWGGIIYHADCVRL